MFLLNLQQLGDNLALLASEYFNSTEVSTMYFLICWGHFISKITLLQYVIRIAFFGGSLMVNSNLPLKTPPKKQYVSRIAIVQFY